MTKSPDDDFLPSLHNTLVTELGDIAMGHEYVANVMSAVIHNWGGQQVYVHKLKNWQKERRDRLIHSRFNGNNIDVLCREFDLSEQMIYRIIKDVQAEKQTDLFSKESNHE